MWKSYIEFGQVYIQFSTIAEAIEESLDMLESHDKVTFLLYGARWYICFHECFDDDDSFEFIRVDMTCSEDSYYEFHSYEDSIKDCLISASQELESVKEDINPDYLDD